ncbi:MAG: 4-hydroxyphenylacetate 3-hydroxylase [Chloroflexota bacterium]|nr:4-hydroxyphenylacetate 3-hydroxylase [Chloroflexota bacterium]
MVLDTQRPEGAMTGERYIKSLQDGREVFLDGRQVADVTTEPAFAPMIKELARIYDLQHTDEYRDEMTYESPDTGNRVSLSWMIPESLEQTRAKRRNSEIWNEQLWGQLGRGPDILAPYILMLYNRRDALGQVKNPNCDFRENIINYTHLCRENDLFLTHALGDPQVDRSLQPQNERRTVKEEDLALHVVEETKDGIIVTGGKQLSTAAHMTNETYVSLSATFARRADPKFYMAFSIASGTPGLKTLVREPVGMWQGTYGHPFLALDEQDAMLFFDNVLVPWDRVFMLYEPPPTGLGPGLGGGLNLLGWSNMCRVHFRMKLMTAVTTMIAKAIGVYDFREVGAKLGEMVSYCELWRYAMAGVEETTYIKDGVQPVGSAAALQNWFAFTSQRMVQLMREVCGSGIIMQPSEADLANPDIRKYLDLYMRGKDVDVEYKSRLYRIAHDLAASSFGMRQDIYEYWHAGDPTRNRVNMLRAYDQSDMIERIEELISKPLPHGEQL